jgi:hypothetical protein
MINRLTYFLIMIFGLYGSAQGQEDQQESFPRFYPGISSVMLDKFQVEIGLYSSFWMTDYLAGNIQKPGGGTGILRFEGNLNHFSNLFQATIGLGNKFAVGADISRTDFFYAFTEGMADTTFHSWRAGPRIRWAVFQNRKTNLVIQHYLYFPVSSGQVRNPYNDLTFGNQFILSNLIGSKFLMTNQIDLVFFKKTDYEEKIPIYLPYTFFFSYLLNTETMLFTILQYQAEFGEVAWDTGTYYNRRSSAGAGLGAQFRIARNLSINAFVNQSFYTSYQGTNRSINLGIRYGTD